MDETEKRLKLLRDMEKLLAEPVKDEGYESPLEGDVLKFKGKKAEPEPIQRIKVGTEKIDTKKGMPILSGQQFKNKIEALRKKPSGSSFAQTKSKIMPGLSNLSLGLDVAQGNYDDAAKSTLSQVAQKAPAAAVSALSKVAPKIAAGLAAPAAGLGMLVGEAVASENVGEGSDTGVLTKQQEQDVESVRDISRDEDTLNSARFKALQRMLSNK